MLSLDSHYKPLYVYTEPRIRHADFTHQRLGKRAFDICVALLVIILILSWLIPIVSLLIRLGSPGPVLYIQKRTGHRGEWFYCLKFRTMTHNPKSTFKQASQDDQRITPLGHFLRRTNLDEMPQFLNVLWNDMSVVGPRPHPIELDAQYWNVLPKYRSRYRVKPGITGLAQICGCRGETGELLKMQHRVKYDRFYTRKKSAWFDVWICWMTAVKMFKGDKNAW